LSVIKAKREPKIVEIAVADGVQTVRLKSPECASVQSSVSQGDTLPIQACES